MVYKAGVIGCGNAGMVHAEVLNAHPRAEFVSVCDPDKDRRNAVSNEFNIAGYESIDELLIEQTLDAIHVCSPVQSHASIAITAIENGVSTLIEKPLARDVEECQRIISARDEHDVQVGTVHNRLYTDRMMEAKQQVENGEIRDIIAVDLLYSTQSNLSETTRGDWVFDLPGGELGETMPHHAYLALAFVSRLGEINGVTLQNIKAYDKIEFDGISMTAMDDSNDVVVTLRTLTNSSECYQLTLFGTNGILRIDLRHTPGVYLNSTVGFSPQIVITNFLNEGRQLIGNFLSLVESTLKEQLSGESKVQQTHTGHYRIIEGFIEAVGGTNEVPVSIEEGLDTIRIIEALEEP